jgi:serine/threonine protein phosphatase PrpC/CRP-like cAMP-binding protein
MNVKVASRTDVGRVRTNNEDNFHADAETGLFIVCDGMGGHSAGEVASRICCETLVGELPTLILAREAYERSNNQSDVKSLAVAVEAAMSLACKEINKQSSAAPNQQGMGTTCTMVLLAGHNKGILAHVGDSRLYVLRGGQVHQLSEDHTYVNELVKRGALSREQAANHPQGNVLSRAMGVQPSISVDTMIFDIDPEDTYLLCSDGVYNYYPKPAEIATLIDDADLNKAVDGIIHNALERGGHDNCTAVIFRTTRPAQSPAADPATAAQRRIAALQRIPIFTHLTYQELVKVLGLTQMTQLPPKTTFIREGQAGHEFFVILSGEVEVVKGGSMLSTLGAGAHLGEMAMVDNAPRSATVTTRNDVGLLVMRRDEFFGIIKGDPVIASKLLWSFVKVLSGRLRKTNEALQDARQENTQDISEFDIFRER